MSSSGYVKKTEVTPARAPAANNLGPVTLSGVGMRDYLPNMSVVRGK